MNHTLLDIKNIALSERLNWSIIGCLSFICVLPVKTKIFAEINLYLSLVSRYSNVGIECTKMRMFSLSLTDLLTMLKTIRVLLLYSENINSPNLLPSPLNTGFAHTNSSTGGSSSSSSASGYNARLGASESSAGSSSHLGTSFDSRRLLFSFSRSEIYCYHSILYKGAPTLRVKG